MVFSKACEYGIRASLYIAHQSLNQKRATLKDIAEDIGSPVAFTAKILQQLTKNNLIDSTKGPMGGFHISPEKMKQIKLVEIVGAIDGLDIFTQCGLGLKECSETKPCPVHNKFKNVREGLFQMMDSTSVFELATGLEKKLTYLKH